MALIVGVEAVSGLSLGLAGSLAALASAGLYGAAAVHGRRLSHIGAVATAMGTMLWAVVVLVPAALVVDRPWALSPSAEAIGAALALGFFCTALALMIYFRLIRTLGPMGVASQAYLRAGVGVLLGVAILGETIPPTLALGLVAALMGVAMINWRRG